MNSSKIAEDWQKINWSSVWNERLVLIEQHSINPANLWADDKKAENYWNFVCSNPERHAPVLKTLSIKPGMKVLDIGGGPGTFALPFAEMGADVTVIEPSSGMIKILERNIKNTNIRHIKSTWEELDIRTLPCKFDIVFAGFSILMSDIVESIRKMEAVCSGKVVIVWFSGDSFWDKMKNALFLQVINERYNPPPRADLLYMVLQSIGISPQVSSYGYKEVYDSIESAALDITDRIGWKEPECLIPLLDDFIIKKGNKVLFRELTMVSIISWNVNYQKEIR